MQNQNKQHLFTGLAVTLAMLLIVFISFQLNTPPAVVPSGAPASEFSAERTLPDLSYIASLKNPIGSQANETVRQYIIDRLRELDVWYQLHMIDYYEPGLQRAATLGNILVRIPGTGNGKAIMFMGHYDTVPDAYGASDNGAAVVAMLELIRLLQHHPPFKNDLIFFFPDGEEVGLLGARAFLKDHPWARDVHFVVNLEARGTGGRSLMFETGFDNLKTISAFAKTVPHPAANSLSFEIYARMPNDTDFSPFKHRGYHGVNMAYIKQAYDYHTAGDNLENTDLRSIQHHGSYITAIALKLGNEPLDFESGQNAVYFNTIGSGFAYYPYSWATPLAMAILLVLILVLAMGIIRKTMTPLGALSGIVAFLLHLLILFTLAHSMYHILARHYPDTGHLLLEYSHQTLMLGFAGISVAFSMFFYRMIIRGARVWQVIILLAIALALMILGGQANTWRILASIAASLLLFLMFRKPSGMWDLSAGALISWAGAMLVVTFTMPGGSFLFAWPLIAGLLAIALITFMTPHGQKPIFQSIILVLFAIPALAWLPAISHLFSVAMGLEMTGVAMLLIGLMMGLLIPHMDIITKNNPLLMPSLILLTGLFFMLTGTTGLGYDERHRKPNNILYTYNDTTGEVLWVSTDKHPDAFTKQFLTENPEKVKVTDFFPVNTNDHLAWPADTEPLQPPVVEVLRDTMVNGERNLGLNIRSERGAAWISTYIMAGMKGVEIQLEGQDRHPLRPYRGTHWHNIRYFAPPETGFDITIYIETEQTIELRITDHVFGIPDFIDYQPRLPHMMPAMDQSLAARHYIF